MYYFTKDIMTKYDYRKGKWTCSASSVGIELSNCENPYPEIMKFMTYISKKTQLDPFIMLYKSNRFGFNRVEQYKGLKSQESDLSLYNCFRFCTEDDKGCSYMFSCAHIDLNVTSPRAFAFYQAIIFLGDEINYQDVLTMIPKLKSVEMIENYLIQSGMIIIETEDTYDMGYYLWLISDKKKIQSLISEVKNEPLI